MKNSNNDKLLKTITIEYEFIVSDSYWLKTIPKNSRIKNSSPKNGKENLLKT